MKTLERTRGMMISSGDKSFTQIAELDHAMDQLASGNFVLGGYHFSLAIYADSQEQLSQNIAAALKNGNLDYAQLEAECIRRLSDAGWVVDYVEIRHAESLAVARTGDKALVVLAAARLGTTRLIDNLEVSLA